MKTRELSWKAVRRGAVYCAPACGFNCTHAAYEKAHAMGKKLAKQAGKGWTVRVWENLGWHHDVVSPCGRITVNRSVHDTTDGRTVLYTAFLRPRGDKGPGGRWADTGTSIEEAIQGCLAQARAAADVALSALDGLEKPGA